MSFAFYDAAHAIRDYLARGVLNQPIILGEFMSPRSYFRLSNGGDDESTLCSYWRPACPGGLTTNTYSEEKHNAPQNSEREKQDPSALESAYRSSILEFSHVLPDLSVETITFRQFESNWRGPRSRVAFIINVGCPAERALIEIDTETSRSWLRALQA